MVLGQYRAVLAGTWWFWVSMGRYWLIGQYGLIYDVTGSVEAEMVDT